MHVFSLSNYQFMGNTREGRGRGHNRDAISKIQTVRNKTLISSTKISKGDKKKERERETFVYFPKLL